MLTPHYLESIKGFIEYGENLCGMTYSCSKTLQYNILILAINKLDLGLDQTMHLITFG